MDAGSAAPARLPGVTPRGWAARKTRTVTCVGHTVCPARRRCALTTARRRARCEQAGCELGGADCVHLDQTQVGPPAGYLFNQHGSMLGVPPNRIVITCKPCSRQQIQTIVQLISKCHCRHHLRSPRVGTPTHIHTGVRPAHAPNDLQGYLFSPLFGRPETPA